MKIVIVNLSKRAMSLKYLALLITTGLLFSCKQSSKPASDPNGTFETTGSVEQLNPKLTALIAPDNKIEILASGFTWSEGPLWLPEQQQLIFSDVPENVIYSWSESKGLNKYLKPSGFNGDSTLGKEGSNGLLLDENGALILCQHGNRQLARMKADLSNPLPVYEAITSSFDGKKYNSPNDAALSKSGSYYFTDPPYGLKEDDVKELDFQGVYRVNAQGEVTLLIDSLTRPNGIALSPDQMTLYVAVSDPAAAKYYAYQLDTTGNIVGGKVLLDVTELGKTRKGSPDGLKVHSSGNIFATGPGGVLVISPEGELLGTILTGQSTANCGFNVDESVLYMTAHMHLMRIKLKP